MRIDHVFGRLAQDSTRWARGRALVLAGLALRKVGKSLKRAPALEMNEFKFIY
jgi:hypothetical protein